MPCGQSIFFGGTSHLFLSHPLTVLTRKGFCIIRTLQQHLDRTHVTRTRFAWCGRWMDDAAAAAAAARCAMRCMRVRCWGASEGGGARRGRVQSVWGVVARLGIQSDGIPDHGQCGQRRRSSKENNGNRHLSANPEVVAYSRRRRFTKGYSQMPFVSFLLPLHFLSCRSSSLLH